MSNPRLLSLTNPAPAQSNFMSILGPAARDWICPSLKFECYQMAALSVGCKCLHPANTFPQAKKDPARAGSNNRD
ncbi:hypothetical protein EMIT0P258_70300 [Pseudomonas sp. IT-P258]